MYGEGNGWKRKRPFWKLGKKMTPRKCVWLDWGQNQVISCQCVLGNKVGKTTQSLILLMKWYEYRLYLVCTEKPWLSSCKEISIIGYIVLKKRVDIIKCKHQGEVNNEIKIFPSIRCISRISCITVNEYQEWWSVFYLTIWLKRMWRFCGRNLVKLADFS